MTAAEFAARPAGQRALIVAKVVDLTESGNARLEVPTLSLLQHLIRLGRDLDPAEYEEVIDLGLIWGFRHRYGTGEVGKTRIRRALAAEAPSLSAMTYSMVAKKVLDFFKDEQLEEYDEPRLNGSRELVSNLMANRSCDEEAPALAALRRQIDAEHRNRG